MSFIWVPDPKDTFILADEYLLAPSPHWTVLTQSGPSRVWVTKVMSPRKSCCMVRV